MQAPRIGLTQRVDEHLDRRERRDALDQAWITLLEREGFHPVPLPNRLADIAGFVRALQLYLVVLTGGNDIAHLPDGVATAPERDNTEARILDLALAGEVPVLGVCRGFQILIHHTGGALQRVPGHAGQSHVVTVLNAGGWPFCRDRMVNSFHEWVAFSADLGPALRSLARAPDGTVEAACNHTLPIVGIMWHPERALGHAAYVALVEALLQGRP